MERLEMHTEFKYYCVTPASSPGTLRMNSVTDRRMPRNLVRVCAAGLLAIASAIPLAAQSRSPVPTIEQQREFTKVLAEAYGLEKLDGSAKKQNTVRKLLEASRDSGMAAGERYVVLTTAITLAREVGAFEAWLEAVNELVDSFEMDAAAVKSRMLAEFLGGAKALSAVMPAVEESLAVARAAALENRYADANSLLSAASSATGQFSGATNLKRMVAVTRESIAARERHWNSYQKATVRLKANADDPVANADVGRWHVLQESEWKAALPFLVKAGHPKWKAAAELEQAGPTDAMSQVAVGDAWWDLAQSEPADIRKALLLHAGRWYEQALPTITSALKKQLVTKRLSEIAPLKPSVEPESTGTTKPGVPAKPDTGRPPGGGPPAKPGDWVDLLQWAEGVDWASRGFNWHENIVGEPTRLGIRLRKAAYMTFPLPAIIDGDYEMEVEFTRHEGQESLMVQFPVGTHQMRLMMGVDNGKATFVEFVNRAPYGERRPSPIANDQRHRLLIRVHDSPAAASFQIDLDGQPDFIQWEGPPSALANRDVVYWRATMIRHPWIGGWGSDVEFHKIRVRMLSGTIQRDAITDADREEDKKEGMVRLVGETPISTKVGEAQFRVNQIELNGTGTTGRRWPLITRDFKMCDDFYGAKAPSRLKCPIPPNARSFSVVAYNDASRWATFQVLADGKLLHESASGVSIIKTDLPPKCAMLELVTEPVEDVSEARTYWCYPRFHAIAADRVTEAMLDGKSALKFQITSSAVNDGGLTYNTPVSGAESAPVHFRNARPCDEFLFAIAPSSAVYQVPPAMTRFTAIGYNVVSHSVKYEVWADARRIFESPKAGIVPIDVKLPTGTKMIELKIDNLGNSAGDMSMWCYPRLYRQ